MSKADLREVPIAVVNQHLIKNNSFVFSVQAITVIVTSPQRMTRILTQAGYSSCLNKHCPVKNKSRNSLLLATRFFIVLSHSSPFLVICLRRGAAKSDAPRGALGRSFSSSTLTPDSFDYDSATNNVRTSTTTFCKGNSIMILTNAHDVGNALTQGRRSVGNNILHLWW